MAKRIKFSTCSATKSFATAENAEKAFQKLYEEYDLRFIVVKLDEHNYEETAKNYQISYQQARNYIVKYEKVGIDGLQDRRGKCKPESEMNELEKLRAENKILRAEKERAEMETSFLKKLEKIERKRG